MSSMTNTDLLEAKTFGLAAQVSLLADDIRDRVRQSMTLAMELCRAFDAARTVEMSPEELTRFSSRVQNVALVLDQIAESVSGFPEAVEIRRLSANCVWLSQRMAQGLHSIVLSPDEQTALTKMLDDDNESGSSTH